MTDTTERVYHVTIGDGPNPEEVFWSTDHDDFEKVKADVRYYFNYLPDAPMKVVRWEGPAID